MSEPFVATQPWSPTRPETLVVCCSDGRWRAQIEEYIGRAVSLQADLYAIPGGAAAFDFMSASVMEAHALESAFRFLAEHHQLRSVWLIAHEGCAYYLTKRGFSTHREPRERQMEDLRRARERVLSWFPTMMVNAVYASLDGSRVTFTAVT